MTVAYRLQQGVRALAAFALPLDASRAAQVLGPALFPAFCALRRVEQQHGLRVLRALEAAATGPVPHALAVAALLHDAGKARWPLAVWQKSLAVAARRLWPRWAAAQANRDPRHPLARAFVVQRHHPAWSAAILALAGADADAIWLVAHHAAAPDDPAVRGHPLAGLLARLQAADDTH